MSPASAGMNRRLHGEGWQSDSATDSGAHTDARLLPVRRIAVNKGFLASIAAWLQITAGRCQFSAKQCVRFSQIADKATAAPATEGGLPVLKRPQQFCSEIAFIGRRARLHFILGQPSGGHLRHTDPDQRGSPCTAVGTSRQVRRSGGLIVVDRATSDVCRAHRRTGICREVRMCRTGSLCREAARLFRSCRHFTLPRTGCPV